ncbi:MAG: outer membrane lipid asymmetry maintenance protein MlaD [Woeseiaceae bacterium]|nr:outer membrane lipid asymmetry maintenance protein MlaD [Woeseiaceae bacterium]
MSNSARAIDVSVGLFILLGLGAVTFLVAQTFGSGGLVSGEFYTVQARFGHVGDLKVRAPVSLAGVTIGRVSEISVDPIDYKAIVELRISSQFDQLPVDTDATIATTGLLGGKYIELGPGGDVEVLKDHDEIQITQSAILLENLIGKYLLTGNAEPKE